MWRSDSGLAGLTGAKDAVIWGAIFYLQNAISHYIE